MPNVLYSPLPKQPQNDYPIRMAEIIGSFCDVKPLPPKKVLFKKLFLFKWRRCDIIITNWECNCIVGSGAGKIRPLKVFKLFLNTLLIKACSRKCIFVKHNRYPHKTSVKHIALASRIVDVIESMYSSSVAHSRAETTERRHYVPHPLYNVVTPRLASGRNQPDYYLVFGRIEPYKNIHELVESFPPKKRLVIAGRCGDGSYLSRLKSLATGKAIEFIPHYLSNEEATGLISGAKAIIQPHVGNDVIVSGSYFYAISIGAPVIAINSPFYESIIAEAENPALFIRSSMEELCNKLGAEHSIPRSTIMSNAKRFHGDHEVARNWKSVFEQLGVKS